MNPGEINFCETISPQSSKKVHEEKNSSSIKIKGEGIL
jgi:hypothetical protein